MSSSTSWISANHLNRIIESIKMLQTRATTKMNYISIWRKFNAFIVRLDETPKDWEDRVALCAALLIDEGIQSNTLKSYISAIKAILKVDGYKWDDTKLECSVFTKACHLKNDALKVRLPIHSGLLELMLFEGKRIFDTSPYLESMYKALFALGYYGMMRVGELTFRPHVPKASDIHIGKNKNKILLILYTSKTHDRSKQPQEIHILSLHNSKLPERKFKKRFFCPFRLTRKFLHLRGDYVNEDEQFFMFADGSPVRPCHVRSTLRKILTKLNINCYLYDSHSLRIGRTSNLFKQGISIDNIKKMGRWRSNAVYKYIKTHVHCF